VSWNKAPIWGLRPNFYYCQTVAGLLMSSALTRGRICRLQLLLALASAVIFGSESHILLSQIRDFPFCRLLRLAGIRWRYSTATAAILYLLGVPNRGHRVVQFSSPLSRKRRLCCAGNVWLRCCENNAYGAVGWQWTPCFGSYVPVFRPCLPTAAQQPTALLVAGCPGYA
jgi:hypothetical protein